MSATKSNRKRKRTYTQLIEQLETAGYDRQFYIDQVDEYMIYYDNLAILNERLNANNLSFKDYNEILKEKRQVTKEMRNILTFLKLRPSGDELAPTGNDEDEML